MAARARPMAMPSCRAAVTLQRGVPAVGKNRACSTLALATWERAEQAPGILNLAIGQPASSLLPLAATQSAANGLSSYDPRHLLQYGSISGSSHYLTAVASFLGAQLAHEPSPNSLFATPGNSGGLSLVTRTLTSPGDRILIEDPSYFLAHQIFRDHYLDLIPLAQRSDGRGTLDMDLLKKVLWRSRYLSTTTADNPMPKFLYCVPTGNNPTGRTMGDDDRARLVELCAEYNVRIVADDVYELLQYGQADAPRPLREHAASLGADATVVSLGSWSKVLGPGLRLGWVEADADMVSRLAADGEVDSGSLTSPLVESLVTSMLVSGDAARHLDALRQSLSKRAEMLASSIQQAQPHGSPPLVSHIADAGYFLWVDLRGLDAEKLRERCLATHGVSFLPGARCALDPAAGASHARVCYAFLEVEELREAGRRLGRAIVEARTEH